MLTPNKIKNHHFEASGRNAYKADSVDSFFEDVADSYEQMFRENGEMLKKINLLAERLEEYRKDEENIQAALLTAHRMSDKMEREAKAQAEEIVNAAKERTRDKCEKTDAAAAKMLEEAENKAKRMLEDAKLQADKIMYEATYKSREAAEEARIKEEAHRAALEAMQEEVTKFKKLILESYNKQLSLIEELPEIVIAEKEEELEEEKEPTQIPQQQEEAEIAEEIVAEAESEESEDVNVDALQQMLDSEDESEETEDEEEETAEESVEEAQTEREVEIPGFETVDVESETDTSIDSYIDEEASENDVMFTKPKADNEAQGGFKVNFEHISAYSTGKAVIDEDEFDEDDDEDSGEGFSSKLKGFFRK